MAKKKQASTVMLSLSGKELSLGLYGGVVILMAVLTCVTIVASLELLSVKIVQVVITVVITAVFLLPLFIHDIIHKHGKAVNTAVWIFYLLAIIVISVAFIVAALGQ